MKQIQGAFLILIAFVPARLGNAKVTVSFNASDGTRLHGEYYPSENARAVLLVVHGLQSHAGWYANGEANASAGIASLAYDRRGSGRSGGTRGHADSIESLYDDFGSALKLIERNNSSRLPVHIAANSLGAVIALNYLAQRSHKVASIILSTPGTHSTDAADYSLLTKLAILVAPANKYFETPLNDAQFVAPGPYLDWIKNDALSARRFTAAFLRSVNSMRGNTETAIDKLDIPLLLLLAKGDEVVDNAAIYKEVYQPYQGEKQIREYAGKHYLFFGPEQAKVARDIRKWILTK